MNDAALKIFSRFNAFLYRLSHGRLGASLAGAPVLLLTVVGRKSGQPRTVPLLYLRDAERYVVVASKGGDPKDPDWWLNLKKTPQATILVGEQELPVTAVQASREEKGRLWPLLVQMYAGYADYQKRTTRDIPVVILTPR
ncbi:MAG: nitroreductase family deazaflavin-dependent oxidoreductase [Candidatus Xenobia bacterium]